MDAIESIAVTTGFVFIDGSLENLDTLLGGIAPGTWVVVLDPAQDGLAQIAAAIAGVRDLAAIHIVSHGAPGSLALGSSSVDSAALADHAEALAAIGSALSANGDLLLYGCDVASGAAGQAFIAALANATGADVAASNDLTGAAFLGGDWVLEAASGPIETVSLTLEAYDGTLTPPALPSVSLADIAAGSGGFVIHGINASDRSGFSVASGGDINGDGFDDLIIGAISGGAARTGDSYVVFGKAAGFGAAIELADVAAGSGGFVIRGQNGGDLSGFSVASAGDINGDGFDDLLIGAPNAQGAGAPRTHFIDPQMGRFRDAGGFAGESYLLFGQAGGFAASVDLADIAAGNSGFVMRGLVALDNTGSSVASAGDINGDGFDDFIIGAPNANGAGTPRSFFVYYNANAGNYYGHYINGQAGRNYVIFGKGGGFGASVDLAAIAAGNGGFVIDGHTSGDQAGASVASAGDFNGDGFADLIIGAPGVQGTGAAYVVFGKASGFAALDLANVAAGTGGFVINGGDSGDSTGRSVASAGDINGDGFADLIVGAPAADAAGNAHPDAGDSYVILGRAGSAGNPVNLASVAAGSGGFVIHGVGNGNQSGLSVASAGDINGDGYDDLIIGAPNAQGTGASYVVLGQAAGFGAGIDLASIAAGVGGFVVTGQDGGDQSGFSVAAAGDLNGDGFDDLIVGAPTADATGNAHGDAGDSYVIFGRDFTATVTQQGGAGADSLAGSAGNDIMVGGLGNDTLDGGAGNDALQGGAGDDLLTGGTGADTLDGGGGRDTATYIDSAAAVTVNLASHLNSGGDAQGDRLAGIENLIGSAGGDTLTGDVEANRLSGQGGDDTLVGAGGNDTLDGGAGNDSLDGGTGIDRVSYASAGGGVTVSLTNTAAQNTGGAGVDTLANFEQLQGTAFNDVLTGSSGNDTLEGGAGNDTLDGADGIDRISYAGASAGVSVSLALTGAQNTGGAGTDTLNHFEQLEGSAFNDALTGSAGFDTIIGGAGNDTINGGTGGGIDVLDGGPGIDLLSFAGATAPVVFNLATGLLGGGPVLYAISNFEQVQGGDFNDMLTGSAADDTLDGGAGNDTLAGAAGDDTYIVDSALDLVNESFGEGFDSVASSVTYTLRQNLEQLVLTGTRNINGTGNSLDNILVGNGSNNVLSGLAGNDTYIIDASDTVVESAGGGIDTVKSDFTITALAANVENLQLTGSGNVNGTGNTLANLVTGNIGNNSLSGGDGNDTLDGGAGSPGLRGEYTRFNGYSVDVNGVPSYNSFPNYNALSPTHVRVDTSVDFPVVGTGFAGFPDLGEIFAVRWTGSIGIATAGLTTFHLASDDGSRLFIDNQQVINNGGAHGMQTVSASVSLTPGWHDLRLEYFQALGGAGISFSWDVTDSNGQVVATEIVPARALAAAQLDNDTLDGGAGIDRATYAGASTGVTVSLALTGPQNTGAGIDTLANIEQLEGSAFNDALTGGNAGDTLLGGTGNDTLDGGGGADNLIGGAGDDTFAVDNLGDMIVENAGEGTDTVQSSINYTLATGATSQVERLVLTGSALTGTGNDLDNLITGNAANNTLDGGSGADTLAGGTGNDTYVVDNAGDVVIELANGGSDTVRTSLASYVLPNNVEALILTGTTALNATGNALANTLTGNTLANDLDGGAGADTMVGGKGDDFYHVDDSGDVVTEKPGEGNDTVFSTLASYVLPTNVETLVLEGTHQDVDGNFTDNLNGTGNFLSNIIYGNAGNNVLDGGLNADIMIGGKGDDVYKVDNPNDIIIENFNEGTDRVESTISFDLANNVENLTLDNIDNITLLGAGNNAATGNNLDNVLIGNSGNNLLDGRGGKDSMSGGLGDDTYVVEQAEDVVTELAGQGTDLVRSTLVSTTLGNNLENLTLESSQSSVAINGTGNELNNRITGNAANNSLVGGAGDDTLDGGTGADTMTGNSGDDDFYIDSAGDVVVEASNEGRDAVFVDFRDGAAWNNNFTFSLPNNVEDAFFNFVSLGQITEIVGNALANELRGNDGANKLNGGAGADTMAGGKGDDIYFVDNNGAGAITVGSGGDQVVELGDEGVDTVNASVDYTLTANVENLILTGSALAGTGNSGSNMLGGTTGDNVLNGGAGNDTMEGGAGNDTYYVDSSSDVVVEDSLVGGFRLGLSISSGGIDTVISTANFALPTGVENLVFAGIDNLNGIGNSLNNAFTGNNGNNLFDGGAGQDGVSYATARAGVTVNLATGQATGGGGFDALVSIEDVTGSGYADTLLGNEGNNALSGGSGGDTLIGGAGNDTLAGGLGADTYYVDDIGDVVVETDNTLSSTTTGFRLSLDLGSAIDKVIASINYALGLFLENLNLTGSAIIGTGNSDPNFITGNSGNNALNGLGGNDTLLGGAGNDTIDGGTGLDTAVFNANRAAYTIAAATGGFTVTALSGSDGVDLVKNIEILKFADLNTVLTSGGIVDNFSATRYLASNTDVLAFFGPNTDSGTQHYVNAGWSEGRSINGFDAFKYLASNTDLLASLGANADAAVKQYVESGFTSGRQANFDGLRYLASNPDLIASLGASPTAAIDHFVQTGFAAGRSATSFDGFKYIAANPDLIPVFGTNVAAGINHYILDGFSHGRVANFDGLRYVASNPDLIGPIGINEAVAINHYILDGFSHSRTVSFNGLKYLASNPELIAPLNGDVHAAAQHYIETGFGAGKGFGFDAYKYIASYADLIGAFGTNADAGIAHFVADGYTNGRVASFDAQQYLANYSDLASFFGSNLQAAEVHYIAAGFAEQRTDLKLVFNGTTGNDTLTGNAANNVIDGGAGNDTLAGGAGNDTLYGGLGNDSLTGGANSDQFVFNTTPNAATNLDTIADFTPGGTDKLVLDHLVFAGLAAAPPPGGAALAPANFVANAGGTAQDGNDYIVYNSVTGQLFYDPDGNGVAAATPFAILTTHPVLAAADFTVL